MALPFVGCWQRVAPRDEDIAARTREYMLAMETARSSKPVDWRATTASLPTSMARYWRERIVNTASSLLSGIGTMIAQTRLSDGEIPVRLKSGIEKGRVFAEILFWLHLITLFFGSGVLYSKDNNS